MRKNKYILMAFLFFFFLSVCLPYGEIYGIKYTQNIPSNFQKVTDNGNYDLYADKTSGEFVVLERSTGSMWWSNPPNRENDSIAKGMQKMDLNSQLIIKFADIDANRETLLNTFTGSVNKKSTVYTLNRNGFRIEYSFPQKECKVALDIVLGNGYIEATIPVDEIVEKEPEVLYSISVLPYFAAGSKKDTGYMLVPDGAGALINYNNNKQSYDEYRQNIYGKDLSYYTFSRGGVEQDIKLPVFGAQNGSCGFITVVTEGDSIGSVNARVSGIKNSYNTVYCDFALRTTDINNIGNKSLTVYNRNKINLKNISLRYYLLSGNGCDYNEMATKYREYLINEIGMKEKPVAEDIPFYIEVYGAILKSKNFLGIPYTATQPLTDYKSALGLMKKVKGSGINNIVLKYVNMNKDNISGAYPSKFRLESKLGSKKQLNELISYCKTNNIIFAPNVDLIYFKKGFLGLSMFSNGCRTFTGSYAAQYRYYIPIDLIDTSKEERYLMTPVKLCDKALNIADSLSSLGFDSISMDTLGENLYSDFYENRSNRQESVGYIQKTAKSVWEKLGNIVMSNANVYMLPYTKYVENSPQASSRFDIIDTDIPFYQLVLNGLVSYSTPAVNLMSNPGKAVLTAIENGSSLKYTWITGDTSNLINTNYADLYGMDSSAWLDSAVVNYGKLNEVYKKTKGTHIVHHRIVSPGVREITYANGAKIIVNYNSSPVVVDGKYKVEAIGFIIE